MEELRSAEILHREIQNEARKKAEKLLQDADIEVSRIQNASEIRIKKLREEKTELFAQRLLHIQHDIESAIPLEKERFLVSFEDKTVSEALDAYFEKMPLHNKLRLLQNLLCNYQPVFARYFEKNPQTKKLKVSYSGVDYLSIEQIVKDVLGNQIALTGEIMTEMEAENILLQTKEMYVGNALLYGFLLETEDGKICCRITLHEIIEDIMDRYSQELADSLFAGGLPE
ncbi:MAG: hypothetical protein E7062_08605 [Spirochaetaceae bacterium]|nr:hypothetical protein [Spirochaetaceae bacterium]